MNLNEFGRRVKEARVSKKLTQTDVAGELITRNMLSQIENGFACPSLKTAEYLSRTLGVSLSDLIGEENYTKKLTIAKEYLKKHRHGDALEILYPLTVNGDVNFPFADEVHALAALAYLGLAEKERDVGRTVFYAKKCCEYAELGIYANEYVTKRAMDILAKICEA